MRKAALAALVGALVGVVAVNAWGADTGGQRRQPQEATAQPAARAKQASSLEQADAPRAPAARCGTDVGRNAIRCMNRLDLDPLDSGPPDFWAVAWICDVV